MLPEDFKEFFRIFKHGKLLSQYMCNIYLDSLFSLHQESSTKKGQVANQLKSSFDQEIERAVAMLTAYEHLVEKDEVDCERGTLNFKGQISCFNRKYTASILSLTLIGLLSAIYFKK